MGRSSISRCEGVWRPIRLQWFGAALALLLACGGGTSNTGGDSRTSDGPAPSDVEGADGPAPSDVEGADGPAPSDVEGADGPAPSDADESDGEGTDCPSCPSGTLCVGGECIAVPVATWAGSIGGSMMDLATGVGLGPDGRLVVGGQTMSTEISLAGKKVPVPFGKGSQTTTDAFLAGYEADGDLAWTLVFGGLGDDRIRALAVDSDGNTVVSGYTTSDTLFVGDETLSGAGKMDIFLLRVSPDGNLIWAKRFGGQLDDAVFGMSTGPDGTIAVGGYFSSPQLSLGGEALENSSSGGKYDVVVARFDADGDPVWSTGLGGSTFSYAHGTAMDASGNVYAAGGFEGGKLEAEGLSLKNAGKGDAWVARFDTQGKVAWGESWGGPEHDACHCIAVAPDGGVAVVGSFQSPFISFGGPKFEHVGPSGYHDLFVARLNAGGVHQWSLAHGGFDWDLAKNVAVDAAGSVYVGGAFFSPEIDVGGGALGPGGPSGKMAEVLLFKLSAGGSHVWSAAFGGPDDDIGYAVAATAGGRFAAVGSFNGAEGAPQGGSIDFGTGPLPTLGGRDSFYVVFD